MGWQTKEGLAEWKPHRNKVSALTPISIEEERCLGSILAGLRADWGYGWQRLDELVERWSRFVSEVERGYELSLHDYTLELELRDTLEETVAVLPARLAAALADLLTSSDQRLRFATQPNARALAPGIQEGSRWWWFAIPRQVTALFLEELEDTESVD